MTPLVSAAELASSRDVVLLDVRTGRDARTQYDAGHLPGAIFVDLDRDLAAHPDDPAHGGRHPLPDLKKFAETVGRWGIGPDTDVVVYDAQSGGNAAARAWWMLRALGHARVRVLDAGYPAAGIEPTADVPAPRDRGAYPTGGRWALPTLDIEEVDAWRRDPARVLLDARSGPRFRGEEEPFDPIAGHIPGAENLFHMSLVGPDKKLLAPALLRERIQAVTRDRQVAVHCGSGVTACHILLAMDQAGLDVPRLYVGSWSEWCRSGRPRSP